MEEDGLEEEKDPRLHCNNCNCKGVLDIGNQLQVDNNIDNDVTKNFVEVEEKNVVLEVAA